MMERTLGAAAITASTANRDGRCSQPYCGPLRVTFASRWSVDDVFRNVTICEALFEI